MKRNILFLALILICGSISAQQEQHYPVNAHDFNVQGSMAIKCQIQINDEPQVSNEIELGAFINGAVRGSQRIVPITASSSTYYLAPIQVYGNTTDLNVPITFKIYDHGNGVEYDNYEITLDGRPYEPVLTIPSSFGTNKKPVVLNFVTTTFIKPITAYTPNAKDHYYLIASPLNAPVSPGNVTNMLSNNYDLYYFDQAEEKEWINYKPSEQSSNSGFNLIAGKGYLYANSQDVNLVFAGAPYSGNGEVTLTKIQGEGIDFPGWNLVGNPFAETAYIDRSFYVMNEGRTGVIAATANSIPAMEGVFVLASEDGETLAFSTTEPSRSGEQLIVNLTQNRGASIDRAIIGFGEGDVLPKFMLNENNTKLYIPQGNEDYAVVRSAAQGELPLNFRASKNGTYTLDIDAENIEMNYLHLVDNMTGMDVDLLQNPSYTFEATTSDYESRFKLVFAGASTSSMTNDSFAFFNNGNWIIDNEGEAILQVVDVEGRILSSEEINGSVSKRIEAARGVYMLRLVNGSDVKVQKIVVE